MLGFEPLPGPPHVFAVDPARLRYAHFAQDAEGFVLETLAEEALPPGTIAEGPLGSPLPDPAAFHALVAAWIKKLPQPPKDATLLLPDDWLRLNFTEVTELPTKAAARDEILRWKLKRLVPFRVEDLRVSAVELAALPVQEEPLRLLLGFGIERLLSEIEGAFRAAGIRIGFVTNLTLATLAGLRHTLGPGELVACIRVDHDAYTVSFVRDGEPVLYRFKAIAELPRFDRATTIRRDLRLTRSFVRDHIPDAALSRVLLIAPAEEQEAWHGWLSDELEIEPELLTVDRLPVRLGRANAPWHELAPMFGATAIEVH